MKRINSKLKVCLISPPWYPIPPKGYGGTERIVYLLYTGLKQLGCDVTVIGNDISELGVEKIGNNEWIKDLKPTSDKWDRIFQYQNEITDYLLRNEFDIVHDHSKPPGYANWATLLPNTKFIYTVHDTISLARADTLKKLKKNNVFYTSISKSQIEGLDYTLFDKVIYNSVENFEFSFCSSEKKYLLHVGRIMEEKGQDTSIKIANELNEKLILVGKVDSSDKAKNYFCTKIKPFIGGNIEYIEEISGEEKWRLIHNAKAMILPIRWEEPFGLVTAESLICGTPVVTYDKGANKEIIRNGKDGFIVGTEEELAEVICNVNSLDRKEISRSANTRFSSLKMAEIYLEFYKLIIK